MSRNRNSSAQKPDARGGKYFLVPNCLVTSDAWRTASPRVIKAVFVLWTKHTGFNNGKIFLNLQDLAFGMDAQNHKANSKALAEAEARGIIEETRRYGAGARLAREYRLTFIPTSSGPATHDYLNWRPGDAGTRRKPKIGKTGLAETAVETPCFIAETAEGRKLSFADSAEEKLSGDGKPPKFPKGSFAETAAHIVSQSRGSGTATVQSLENARDPRKHAADVITAAPSEDELRARAKAFIKLFGHGTQSELARQAPIPGGTFSKFLNGGPLSAHARVKLACAFGKAEAALRKKGRAA